MGLAAVQGQKQRGADQEQHPAAQSQQKTQQRLAANRAELFRAGFLRFQGSLHARKAQNLLMPAGPADTAQQDAATLARTHGLVDRMQGTYGVAGSGCRPARRLFLLINRLPAARTPRPNAIRLAPEVFSTVAAFHEKSVLTKFPGQRK